MKVFQSIEMSVQRNAQDEVFIGRSAVFRDCICSRLALKHLLLFPSAPLLGRRIAIQNNGVVGRRIAIKTKDWSTIQQFVGAARQEAPR